MRIIAGEFRGRRLLPPEQTGVTRPVTDRVKQSLFDIVAPRLEGARVYDCFAGTGSMGLECLSRGAAHVTFFERDRSALSRLRRNIETVGVPSRCQVVAQDLFQWFAASKPQNPRIDLAFLDPPYRFLREKPEPLRAWAAHVASHLSPDAVVVFRHDAQDKLELSPLKPIDRREYGGMAIELLAITAASASP